jgi:hypothetical protein
MPSFADAFENSPVQPKRAIGLIRPLLFSLIAVPSAASFAQLPKTASIMGTTLSGGSVGKTKIISATAVSAFKLSYKEGESQKEHEVKAGDTIEKLAIESGEILAGTASGGILTWPAAAAVDTAQGTVTAESLNGTLLRGAILKKVKLSTGPQNAKIGGKEISGNSFLADTPDLQFKDANLEAANVKDPAVPPSLVQGQLRPAGTEAANISTVGDYFKFNAKVEHFRTSSGEPRGELTAPKGSCFRVSQEFEDPTDPTQKLARGTFITGWFPRVLLPPYKCLDEESLQKEPLRLDPALSYDVPKRMIVEERDRDRFGWTYGALVAPFKYYRKERDFSAGASVGPYLGYRLHDRQGSSSVLALGIGMATASVTTNNPDGSTSTSNTTGMSAALAYLLDIKGSFNVGFLAGADYYSKSQNVANSGKLWLGLSFGYKLD